MATTYRNSYQISDFIGINEDTSENKLSSSYAVAAENMDTSGGDLKTGYGYKRYSTSKLVDDWGNILRMYYWHTLKRDRVIVANENGILSYNRNPGEATGTWRRVYHYNRTPARHSTEWDILEAKIGNTEYALFADGKGQILKWNGTSYATDGDVNSGAELFGSGEYLLADDTVVSNAYHNAVMAVNAAITTAGDMTTLTCKYDAFTWTEGAKFAVRIPKATTGYGTAQVTVTGKGTWPLSFSPIWAAGDIAMIRCVTIDGVASLESCEEEVPYGIYRVVLSNTIPATVRSRMEIVGLKIGDYEYDVKPGGSGATVDLAEVDTTGYVATTLSANVRGGISNMPVSYLEMYYNRLFAAGDTTSGCENRLYWSQLPGDGRTIEDWSMDVASPDTSGGYVDIGAKSTGRITGLCALSNQLLIFKERAIFRLLGDRPSNFRVVPVQLNAETSTNSGRLLFNEMPFWITRAGLFYYNGQNAAPLASSRYVKNIIANADFTHTSATANRDRMYFSFRSDGDPDELCDKVLVYDTRTGAYMVRTGFTPCGLCADDGRLYMVDGDRHLCVWDESCTKYDEGNGNVAIDAFWQGPLTDLGAMSVKKAPKWLYFRGTGGTVKTKVRIGDFILDDAYNLNGADSNVITVPLYNEGRVLSVRIENEYGSAFKILGGMEIIYEIKRD